MENRLIILTSDEILEERMRKECKRIAEEVDYEGTNPKGTKQFVIGPIYEEQLRIIESMLTPTLWADYSLKVRHYERALPFNPDKFLDITIVRRAA